MRWFKHLTAARKDEKMARLFDRSGYQGRGLWWTLLEIVAGQMDGSSQRCSLKYSVKTWAAELQMLPQNVLKQLTVLKEVGLITLIVGDEIEVSIPNLLRYRDEYTAKTATAGRAKGGSGQSADGQSDPKLLKQRDQKSSKSGECQEQEQIQNRTKSYGDRDTNTDTHGLGERDSNPSASLKKSQKQKQPQPHLANLPPESPPPPKLWT
jgi:hypothetical protein